MWRRATHIPPVSPRWLLLTTNRPATLIFRCSCANCCATVRLPKVIELEAPPADWGFKAHKQTMKLRFRRAEFEQMLDSYAKLLVRQLRHHLDHFSRVSQLILPLTRRVMCSTWCPC